MNDNVVDIPPAEFKETYGGYRISYTFVPDLKQWRWEFEYLLQPLIYSDTAVSRQAAIKAAHRQIDKL